MNLLAFQARVPGGPSVFRALANARVPASLGTEFLGLRFPSPIGVGAGIDLDGRAAPLIQELGAGFIELGPVGLGSHAPTRHRPRRLRRTQAVATNGAQGGMLLDDLNQRAQPMSVPVGAQLCSADVVESIRRLPSSVDFATIPAVAGGSGDLLAEARAATDRPLLLRVPAGWEKSWIEQALENAAAAEIDGIQVAAASPFAELEEGELVWRGALSDALSLVARIAPTMPAALTGGVTTPADAEEALAAGARLVSLTDGLIFAGPGLPARINLQLAAAPSSAPADAPESTAHLTGEPSKPRARPRAIGVSLLAGVGTATALAGIAYLFLAATRTLLPPETSHISLGIIHLRAADHSRILNFIAHGRACYGGALLGLGLLWGWLSIGPLKRRESWAWWTMALAGVAFFGGYFDFLAYGYLEPWDATLTFATMWLWATGLTLTWERGNQGPRESLRRPGADAWLWSPAGRSRILLALFGLGLMTAGTMILVIAGSDVFVPQDLEFIGRSPHQLQSLDPHLIALMAHDRGGFGGTMLALGISFLATSWKAVRPQAKGAWRALGVAGASLVVPAFIAHMAVGYTNLIHLSPVYSGSILLVMALVILRVSIWDVPEKERFPDLDPVRLALSPRAGPLDWSSGTKPAQAVYASERRNVPLIEHRKGTT